MPDAPRDLDAIYGPTAGQIKVGGVVYDVRRLSCLDIDSLRAVDWALLKDPALRDAKPAEAEASYRRIVDIASHLVVGMSPEEVKALPPQYAMGIVNLASEEIAKLEAQVPKAEAAA